MLNLNINCDILQEKNIVRFNGAALELMRYEGQELHLFILKKTVKNISL